MSNTPKQIAESLVDVGEKKAGMSALKLLILGFFAGLYIGFAAIGANTISATVENPSLAKFAGAAVFPVGLIMVVIAGSELFTGNSLMLISVFEKRIKLTAMLRNWLIVYIGNLIGSLFLAFAIYYGNQMSLFSNGVALNTIKVAVSKCSLEPLAAILLGMMCNILVCVAVWMSFGAKSVSGKIIAVYMPIMLFVLCGFEHSVANMYYIPAGILAKGNETYKALALSKDIALDNLTWFNFFFANLLPVTVGNILGGGLIVGFLYRTVYLKNK